MTSFLARTRCVPCKSCRRFAAHVGPSAVFAGGHVVRCSCGLSVHAPGKRTDAIGAWNRLQFDISERSLVESGRA